MRQAIHIFLKDSRQLRVPIAISLSCTLLFAITGVHPWFREVNGSTSERTSFLVQQFSFYILTSCWVVLIALVVHAESLPGDRQFWLTRPYNRASLLGAKVLFALAYVISPMTVAQAGIVILDGLPLGRALPGLLWEQTLIGLLVVIPAAALASVTSRLTQFVLSLPIAPLVVLTGDAVGDWNRLEWVRTAIGLLIFSVFAVCVTLWQFWKRPTSRARTLGIVGVLATLVALVTIPWQAAFAVQSQLGSDGPMIEARLLPLTKPDLPLGIKPLDSRLQLRFAVTGLPDDTPIRCEAVSVTIDGALDNRWTSFQPYPEWPSMSLASEGCLLQLTAPDSVRDAPGPAHLRATVYVTVFGSGHRETIQVDTPGTVFSDGSVCRARQMTRPMWSTSVRDRVDQRITRIECRRAFRPFDSTLFATEAEPDLHGQRSWYSPFPAVLAFRPVFWVAHEFSAADQTGAMSRLTTEQAAATPPSTIFAISRSPVSHVRLGVDPQQLNLADYDLSK